MFSRKLISSTQRAIYLSLSMYIYRHAQHSNGANLIPKMVINCVFNRRQKYEGFDGNSD